MKPNPPTTDIEKRCTCKYEKDGKMLGLCLRCFKMCMDEREKAKQSLIQEIKSKLPKKRGSVPKIIDSVNGLVECDQWDMALDEVLSILEEIEK